MKLYTLLRAYLTLAVIIPPLPFTIANGNVIDATPVMADLNAIVGNVNANAAPLTSIPTNLPTFVIPANVGGTANAITLAPVPAIAAYVAGQRFTFFAAAANTGAVTVNVSGVGAQALLTREAAALIGGELRVNALYEIEYTGAAFNLMSDDAFDAVTAFPTAPFLAFGGSVVGITYSSQAGNFFKVGRMIFYWLKIVLTNKGAAAGVATVGGFPFAIAATILTNSNPFGTVTFNTVTTTSATPVIPIPIIGTTTCQFAYQVVNLASPPNPLDNTSFANASTIQMSGMYPI